MKLYFKKIYLAVFICVCVCLYTLLRLRKRKKKKSPSVWQQAHPQLFLDKRDTQAQVLPHTNTRLYSSAQLYTHI